MPDERKKSLYIVPAVKLNRQKHDFLGRQHGARRIVAPPVHAVFTVINAGIRHQDLQQ